MVKYTIVILLLQSLLSKKNPGRVVAPGVPVLLDTDVYFNMSIFLILVKMPLPSIGFPSKR